MTTNLRNVTSTKGPLSSVKFQKITLEDTIDNTIEISDKPDEMKLKIKNNSISK